MRLKKKMLYNVGDKITLTKDISTPSVTLKAGTEVEIIAKDGLLRTYDIMNTSNKKEWVTDINAREIEA